MAHSLPHSAVGVGGKPRVLFQLTQGDHSADGKALFGLLNGIQPQTGKVNGGADIDGFHLQPDHAAQNAVCFFLVQLPRFLQTFCPLVFSDRHHVQYLSFLSLRYLCFYFSTAFGIILL